MRVAVARMVFSILLAGVAGCGSARGISGTPAAPAADRHAGMVLLPGGRFTMGSDRGFPNEAPAHAVTLSPFWIDVDEVTNDTFARFVAATGFVTEAERFGW